jgi:hypothetical protein
LSSIDATWLPPDTLTVLKLDVHIPHVRCTHMLTTVLVLHLTCSSIGCQQHTVSGQLHTFRHFTAAAAAPTVAQLYAALVSVQSEIIRCSIWCCCFCYCCCCGNCKPGSGSGNRLHTHLGGSSLGRKVPQSTSLIACHTSTCAAYHSACANIKSFSICLAECCCPASAVQAMHVYQQQEQQLLSC